MCNIYYYSPKTVDIITLKDSETRLMKVEAYLDSAIQVKDEERRRKLVGKSLAQVRWELELIRREQGHRQRTFCSPGEKINPKKPWNYKCPGQR